MCPVPNISPALGVFSGLMHQLWCSMRGVCEPFIFAHVFRISSPAFLLLRRGFPKEWCHHVCSGFFSFGIVEGSFGYTPFVPVYCAWSGTPSLFLSGARMGFNDVCCAHLIRSPQFCFFLSCRLQYPGSPFFCVTMVPVLNAICCRFPLLRSLAFLLGFWSRLVVPCMTSSKRKTLFPCSLAPQAPKEFFFRFFNFVEEFFIDAQGSTANLFAPSLHESLSTDSFSTAGLKPISSPANRERFCAWMCHVLTRLFSLPVMAWEGGPPSTLLPHRSFGQLRWSFSFFLQARIFARVLHHSNLSFRILFLLHGPWPPVAFSRLPVLIAFFFFLVPYVSLG